MDNREDSRALDAAQADHNNRNVDMKDNAFVDGALEADEVRSDRVASGSINHLLQRFFIFMKFSKIVKEREAKDRRHRKFLE